MNRKNSSLIFIILKASGLSKSVIIVFSWFWMLHECRKKISLILLDFSNFGIINKFHNGSFQSKRHQKIWKKKLTLGTQKTLEIKKKNYKLLSLESLSWLNQKNQNLFIEFPREFLEFSKSIFCLSLLSWDIQSILNRKKN